MSGAGVEKSGWATTQRSSRGRFMSAISADNTWISGTRRAQMECLDWWHMKSPDGLCAASQDTQTGRHRGGPG